MFMPTIRLGFGIMWGLIGTALLLRRPLGFGDLDAQAPQTNFNVVGAVAVLFCSWNVVRWYAARARPETATPSRNRRGLDTPANGKAEKEYLPEFDFTRPQPSEGDGQRPASSTP